MASTEIPPIYEFGGFRIDATRRLLFAPTGQVIPLKPKTFDTLRYLVERPGQLLDKDALMKAVWGGVVVEENNLNQHISALRQVFGEKPGENRFIVTVPGRGYVFAMPVRALGPESGPAPVRPERQTSSRAPKWSVASVALAAVVAVAGAVAWTTLSRTTPSAVDVVRLTLDLGAGQRLAGGVPVEDALGGLQRPSRRSFALSPDGSLLVYAATDGADTHLYLRAMNRLEPVRLPGTEGATRPFFSPDGAHVGFLVGNVLKRVAVAGGTPRTLAEVGSPADGADVAGSWTDNGTILVSTAAGIFELSDTGGALRRRTEGGAMSTGRAHLYPQQLPLDRGLLINIADGVVPSDWDIAVAAADGAIKTLVDGGSDPRYLPSGHIVFARRGSLWAVGFDLDRLAVTGAEVRVVENVMHAERSASLDLNSGAAQFDVSSAGMLAIAAGGSYPAYRSVLAWLGESGAIEPLPIDSAWFHFPRLSPTGERLAYSTGLFGDAQIWTFELASGVPLRLTEGGHNIAPIWSPDGTKIAFARTALEGGSDGGIYTLPADGGGAPQRIAAGHLPVTASWSTGDVIAFVDGESETQESIFTVAADGRGKVQRFLPEGEVGAYPDFSPDGRWLAYAGLERDRFIVYVRPFPAGTPRLRISPGAGHAPMWARDGRRLFYTTEEWTDGVMSLALMVVDVEIGETLRTSAPRRVGTAPWGRMHPARPFDGSVDGRFVFPEKPAREPPQPVVKLEIVQNWGDELRQLVPRNLIVPS